jgi:hypothetical protein
VHLDLRLLVAVEVVVGVVYLPEILVMARQVIQGLAVPHNRGLLELTVMGAIPHLAVAVEVKPQRLDSAEVTVVGAVAEEVVAILPLAQQSMQVVHHSEVAVVVVVELMAEHPDPAELL